MKIATVKYEGPMTSKRFRGPSGEVYNLNNPRGGDASPVELDNVRDAEKFEKIGGPYTVEWTSVGKVVRTTEGPLESLKEIGYRQKQKLAKEFGVKANQSESDLEEELQPVVEQIVEEEF